MDFFEGLIYMIWRGIAIGIIISAPMGPVGILCVQRTLEKGRQCGFFTGVGAAISDLFYCLLTGFGLSLIEEFLERNHNVIQIIGSVVLIAFGYYLFKSNPSRKLKTPERNKISVQKNILSGFLFTFSNPLIIFLIIGLFARFNFMLPEISFYHYLAGFVFIFVGAIIWWWLVSYFVDKVRAHFNLRSMWLINKIIAVIIFIFAIVGIVTAITALANASEPRRIDMSVTSGYALFPDTTPEGIRIDASAGEFAGSMAAVAPCKDFVFSFRAHNINNAARKSYVCTFPDGRKEKIVHPVWGIRLLSSGSGDLMFRFRTSDNPYDAVSETPHLNVEAYLGDSLIARTSLNSGVEFFDGQNAFQLNRKGSHFILRGGNRSYNGILEFDCALAPVDSLGFMAYKGACVNFTDISLEWMEENNEIAHSEFGNPDILSSYLTRSSDLYEEIWEILDRTLDEDYLRSGGAYRLALIKSGGDYEIVYLSGAEKNADRWKPGMSKGSLKATSFPGIFNVSWIDADGEPLDKDVKGQFEREDLLIINFPYQLSTLRLKRVHLPAYNSD